MRNKIIVIGSGFSSLSAACYLAKSGFSVTVLERHSVAGGRARTLKKNGFQFDMGPTWYWMPDIFHNFFNDFGKSTTDYFELHRLDPAYEVFFPKKRHIVIDSGLGKIIDSFERYEPGCQLSLEKYMKSAKKNYQIAMNKIVYRHSLSPWDLMTVDTILNLKHFIQNVKKLAHKTVKNPDLRLVLQFPSLFLGAKPSKTPSFFNFMNHADFDLGTWYPKGGMVSVVQAMVKLAESLGVQFKFNTTVQKIVPNNNEAVSGVLINDEFHQTDIIVSGADYQHTESLLEKRYRTYSSKYWDKRVFAPSALLFYLGFDTRFKGVMHHSLFFDVDFDAHLNSIYGKPKWPSKPMFYANFPSVTDSKVAPRGKESCVLLVPIASGLKSDKRQQTRIFNQIINRMEKRLNLSLKDHIVLKEIYSVDDFKSDYSSTKGNAYGLATTLNQIGFMRPKLKSKKLKNLYFTGQLTVPGPGVPPALISGKIVGEYIASKHGRQLPMGNQKMSPLE
ncbi:MAG: phytoene desaturase family protein [Flavobacteriaceae bacterium]|nr:phytoene desaturase family protein [Flavobacteriaceae bacterium]